MTNKRLLWGAILAIVLASTTGDVLLSRAMKRVGDVGELWRRSRPAHGSWSHPEQSQFPSRNFHDGDGVL